MPVTDDDAGTVLATVVGILGVGGGGTGADLTLTGGTGQVVQQSATGAALTVGQLGLTNLAVSTSAQLRALLSDETGTGAAVFGTSPTIATPIITFPTGGAATYAATGGLTRLATATQTTAVTTEEVLWSYSLPASTLATNGVSLRVMGWGNTAGNANTKTIRVKFGAISIGVNNITTAPNGVSWTLNALISRVSATSQYFIADAKFGSAGQSVQIATPAETLANAITISITGQNGTASAGDISLFRVLLDYVG